MLSFGFMCFNVEKRIMTNNEYEVALQEAVALIAIAQTMLNDPDDRLNFKEKWQEKANEVLRGYFDHVKRDTDSAETRHSDWIGD